LLRAIAWWDAEQGRSAHIHLTGMSADGKLFFGAGDAGPTGTIRLFDVATGNQVQHLRPGGEVWFSTAAFVPGGKYLATAYSHDRDVYLWDIVTGKIARKLTGHTEGNLGLAVAPDGQRLLSWSDDRTLRLWDLKTGQELRKLEGHTDKATGVFSPDGQQILTFSPDKTLRLWATETGKELRKLECLLDTYTVAFTPDGKNAVLCSRDHTMRLCDLDTGKEIRRFNGIANETQNGFVSRGHQMAAICVDQKFRVWDTASGKLLQEIDVAETGNACWTMTATPDGRLALVNHQDSSVRVYDLASGKEIHHYDNCPRARSFVFSPDGNYAVAGSFRAGMFVFRLPPVTP
jgi:WD40 repeat protein